ncbi:hypothetical protein [Bacillus toyonensis]|uniref:hypothetical protein n=1 Tax=Bacillus toyonensis TaxID=155322 RepID=UPI002E1F27C7|nr:hypothetical protein [Bacillus toyonensis]
MVKFESEGIIHFVTYTKKKGFNVYEEDPKVPGSLLIIKPLVTDERLKKYNDKDEEYFKELIEADQSLGWDYNREFILI